jgi:hypothetical protein
MFNISENNSPTSTTSMSTSTVSTLHPIKAKFSSTKSQLLFTFVAPNTRGLHHEKSSCISLTSTSAKTRVACDPRWILKILTQLQKLN